MTNWTKITKPSGTSWTKLTKPTVVNGPAVGSPIGLLLALTYATSPGSTWTKITKASGTNWTKISKAT